MLTTDLSLRFDPVYEKISRKFYEDQDAFADAFSRAWFKLTHRDLGPRERYLGAEVPGEELLWQDPIPAVDHVLVDEHDVEGLKSAILASGLSIAELVTTAWASASTFRGRICVVEQMEPVFAWRHNVIGRLITRRNCKSANCAGADPTGF
ncbi:hypothetical protein KUH03_33060 [Sphingobacterium sp. E70]|uniref:hypothetical protein n=1 Tax=Sphingobacterium sp. E70 TaxID=2853439 RepID=UPI00211CD6EE|nr:hypothetical protein [Sphingobacterium sp. E70]ULT23920.1 hypothetical protein KUH03_33060 [Sphingobacterium sp. E70]